MTNDEDHGAWLLWGTVARWALVAAAAIFPAALLVARRLVR